MVPIFKGKGDIRNCSSYRAWNEDGGNGIRKKTHRIMFAHEMQFGFMPERATIDVFILRRRKEEYHAKGKK